MFTSFHLLYLAMFTFVGSVICLQMFTYSNFQCKWACNMFTRFIYCNCNVYICGVCNMFTSFSFTQPCNVYICWVCNMFSFTLPCNVYICWVIYCTSQCLHLWGFVICLQVFIYSTSHCFHLLGLTYVIQVLHFSRFSFYTTMQCLHLLGL